MPTQYPVLSKGDRGSFVILLQKRLNDWGCSCGIPDGVFGDGTEKAVKSFQSKKQQGNLYANAPLVIDGVVGLQTWAELTKCPWGNIEIVRVPTLVTPNQAFSVFGRLPNSAQMDDLNSCLQRFQITTPPRMRHFLSQIAHESGGLRWLKELASGDAYEGRTDLGNTQPGDGRKFKGAGAIQLTGCANYTAFSKAIADPKVVEIGCDYVAEAYPFTSAGWFWARNGLNAMCDRGATVAQITQVINGGQTGYADRVYYYNKASLVFV